MADFFGGVSVTSVASQVVGSPETSTVVPVRSRFEPRARRAPRFLTLARSRQRRAMVPARRRNS